MPANQFYIWRLSASQPASLSPRDAAATNEPSDIRYYGGVLQALDTLMPDHGLTVLLTWHLDRFDERFRDAVVLLIGMSRIRRRRTRRACARFSRLAG